MANRLFPSTTKARAVKWASVVASAILLPACATQGVNTASSPSKSDYRDAIGVYSSTPDDAGRDPIASAAFWGTRYNEDQSNPDTAVQFSQALRGIGSLKEATEVMQKATARFQDNPDVSVEHGKVLVEGGRAFEAIRYFEAAVETRPDDWRVFSAYGVALDQIGEHAQARKKYDHALSIVPTAQTVLNNKGLSYALEGNLSLARTTLRMAAANTRAGGDARIRQNLALVLALSGKLSEAERLSRSDLPPLVADNNVQFYRQLTSQPAYWDEYAATDVDVPDFEPAPAAPIAPTPAPAPQLREEPKQNEEQKNDGAPIALFEVAPVTNASADAPLSLSEDDDTE